MVSATALGPLDAGDIYCASDAISDIKTVFRNIYKEIPDRDLPRILQTLESYVAAIRKKCRKPMSLLSSPSHAKTPASKATTPSLPPSPPPTNASGPLPPPAPAGATGQVLPSPNHRPTFPHSVRRNVTSAPAPWDRGGRRARSRKLLATRSLPPGPQPSGP